MANLNGRVDRQGVLLGLLLAQPQQPEQVRQESAGPAAHIVKDQMQQLREELEQERQQQQALAGEQTCRWLLLEWLCLPPAGAVFGTTETWAAFRATTTHYSTEYGGCLSLL